MIVEQRSERDRVLNETFDLWKLLAGLGIFLFEHDIHNVMKLCDRASVMKNGQLVGTVNVNEVTDEDILGMIILGKTPEKAA